MGEKKRKWSRKFCRSVFLIATYGSEVISGGGKKNPTPTELFTPFEALYKTCF